MKRPIAVAVFGSLISARRVARPAECTRVRSSAAACALSAAIAAIVSTVSV